LEDALGIILLVLYITAIVTLAGAVTWVAIRIFPTKDRPSKTPDDGQPPADDGEATGRLFRRSKREATG
jgi:hypothetical protein